jgi:hypothetical protein
MIVSLFKLLSTSLVRLVVDIPFRRAQRSTDITLRRDARLRAALLSLTALEEFTSAGDDPWLSSFLIGANRFTHGLLIGSLWPRLECLALYDVDFERPNFTESLDRLESIETVVLTCADGKEEVSTSSLPNIKLIKKLLIINNAGPQFCRPVITRASREPVTGEADDEGFTEITRMTIHVPVHAKGDREIKTSRDWTRNRAVRGLLWNSA